MKTLLVSPYSPYPLVFGGAIRVYHVLKMFAGFSDVTLLGYRTWQDEGSADEHLRSLCVRVAMLDGPPSRVQPKWLLQARGIFGVRPFQYHAFYSPALQLLIDQALRRERYDYIVMEQSQMAYFRLRQPGAIHILDLHNIEHELLARRAIVQHNLARRLALTLEARKFRRDEQAIYRQADLVFTPSERERALLAALPGMPRVETLPNSIDTDYFALRQADPAANELVFVGSSHVDANRDAINYFVQQIFPLIEQRVPDVTLSIVGGDPPAEIRVYGERPKITVTGFVADVRAYMARARVMVVPIRSGGGTRLKILESMSFGLPVVATTIGAEGIDAMHERELLLADDPPAFAAAVERLLTDATLRRRLITNGRKLVETGYSWQAVGRRLQDHLLALGQHEWSVN
ncbi:MAG: glycosyltransferase [Chloroflexi bacterium]|nr:glycosyltransferase [Chloroflexota bacterium]